MVESDWIRVILGLWGGQFWKKKITKSLLSQVLLLSILLFLYTLSQTIYQKNLNGHHWWRAGQWSSSASFASSDFNYWDLGVFHMAWLLEGHLRHGLATRNGTSWFLFQINFYLTSTSWELKWKIWQWKWEWWGIYIFSFTSISIYSTFCW